MITVIRVCRKCGAKIFSDAPEGLCTGCVLETALGLLPEEPDGADNPAPAQRLKITVPKSSGTTMLGELGDYELLEEIGRGGQGVVFRARQKSLNRTVALKVIGLGQWATEVHLKRFRREAEAAASLDHPGIVPIYEVGEHDGSCYFSMKFVEGGQLDEVVGRTPMSIRQAAELIAKVARTVHYAHEHNILHRDIKPGNILLDQKGEAHLTDFGLARLVETESTVTRTKEVLGTPSYMAPEQAVGETGKLTSATDVYGLGAVLYQLLTGHPPFAGGTTYETVRLVLETNPRRPRLWNPKIDRELETICLKCLDKDPKRRYPSALALAQDLEHWLKHEPVQARRAGIFIRGKKWVQRNPISALLVASLVALTAAAGWIVWKTEFIQHPVATNGIAVLPFENLSPDPANAYFADGIQEEILTRLSSIADLKVISRTSTQPYQSKPRNLSQIAKQLGVANILEGSVQKATDQVRINVQLINAQTDSHLWAETFDRKLVDIFEVQTEIAKRIAESLQVKLTGREKQALAVKPTNNAEAYDAYLRGTVLEAGNYLSVYSDDRVEKAASSYERAVQLDPNFAIAWARLSRARALIHSIMAAGGDASKRALDNAQKLAPNSPETLFALGYYQSRVLGDFGAAEKTFVRVAKMLPGNSEVLLALSQNTRRQERWDESIAYSDQALALNPRNVELLMDVAMTYAHLRKFPIALKLYDRVLELTPSDRDVMASKAKIYQAQGNLQEAARLLSGFNWQTPNGTALQVKLIQLTLERNYGEAIRLLQTRLAQFQYVGSGDNETDNQLQLAFTQCLAGDTAGAKVTAKSPRATYERLHKEQPNDAYLAMALSQLYAAMGEKDLALKLAEHALMLDRAKSPLRRRMTEEHLAMIQTMVGENSRAISILTELLQKPYWSYRYGPPAITAVLLRLDPLWDSLRADPAFQKLCEEKQK